MFMKGCDVHMVTLPARVAGTDLTWFHYPTTIHTSRDFIGKHFQWSGRNRKGWVEPGASIEQQTRDAHSASSIPTQVLPYHVKSTSKAMFLALL